MTTRRDFLKTMTMASAGLALGAGDILANPTFASQRKITCLLYTSDAADE